ncbi:MAG: aldose 1-epimerase family protein [Clostridia bacterium]|nr:aldose 1-epimerase family protein [Clostridia bacterium]
MSIVTIKNTEFEVGIKTKGAEITSVKDNSGKEYIWQGDPQFWKDQAIILFPVVGRLDDGKYTFNGKEYEMDIHGFAKDMEFEVETNSESAVTFLLKSNDETRKCYPFDFEFRVAFRLDGRKLAIDFATKNTGSEDMYYSVGAHEGYNIEGDVSNYSIVLDEVETLEKYEVVPEGYISEISKPCFKNSNELRLSDDFFAVDGLIFFDVKSRFDQVGNFAETKHARACEAVVKMIAEFKRSDACGRHEHR